MARKIKTAKTPIRCPQESARQANIDAARQDYDANVRPIEERCIVAARARRFEVAVSLNKQVAEVMAAFKARCPDFWQFTGARTDSSRR